MSSTLSHGCAPVTLEARREPARRTGTCRGTGRPTSAEVASGWHHRAMLRQLLSMPAGVRIFLGYAFLLLGLIGVSLRWVVDQAIDAPVSPLGVVDMCLLAFTIFTTTLVLQRKEASLAMARLLSTLTIPAVVLGLLAAEPLLALFAAVLAGALFYGLGRPAVRLWLSEP